MSPPFNAGFIRSIVLFVQPKTNSFYFIIFATFSTRFIAKQQPVEHKKNIVKIPKFILKLNCLFFFYIKIQIYDKNFIEFFSLVVKAKAKYSLQKYIMSSFSHLNF